MYNGGGFNKLFFNWLGDIFYNGWLGFFIEIVLILYLDYCFSVLVFNWGWFILYFDFLKYLFVFNL